MTIEFASIEMRSTHALPNLYTGYLYMFSSAASGIHFTKACKKCLHTALRAVQISFPVLVESSPSQYIFCIVTRYYYNFFLCRKRKQFLNLCTALFAILSRPSQKKGIFHCLFVWKKNLGGKQCTDSRK